MSRGYIEILSPNFLSRNPLRSCLGPWTHTRVTFIPFFVSRPLNRTPLLPPSLLPLLTKFGWQDGRWHPPSFGRGIILRLVRTIELLCRMSYARSATEKIQIIGLFFFSPPLLPFALPSPPLPPTAPPKFLSIYRKVGIELANGDFWLIFTISVHDPGMVEARSLQYRIYSVRILSGRRHKRRLSV